MENDHLLIKQCLDGNTEAFDQLYLKYEKKLLNFILYRVYYNIDTAQDLLQETMYKVYKNLHRFDFKYGFSTWLYQIALNNIRNFLKKNRNKKTVACDDSLIDILRIPDPSREISPEEAVINKELNDKIIYEIDQLSEELKEVFILKKINDLTFSEIADILNINERKAKYLLSKAIEIFYKRLKDYL